MTVIFHTDGVLDINSVRTFGLSVKLGDNPIGKFGTGIKYAIAVILRNGGSIDIFAGDEHYRFRTKVKSFRGEERTFIQMQKKREGKGWTTFQLPFTTDLGKHWEPWMAFRELESNTRDESGHTEHHESFRSVNIERGHTQIIVDWDKFDEAYDNRDDIFLNTDKDFWFKEQGIEVYKRPSDYLWYRGIRVYKLPKPSVFTYNFVKEMELTEDRTFQYQFMADHYITGMVMHTKNQGFVRGMLSIGPSKYEYSLGYDSMTKRGSELFDRVIGQLYTSRGGGGKSAYNGGITSRASGYYNSHIADQEPTEAENLAEEISNWIRSGDLDTDPDHRDLLTRTLSYLDPLEAPDYDF